MHLAVPHSVQPKSNRLHGGIEGRSGSHTSSRQHHPPILKHSHFYQPRWSSLGLIQQMILSFLCSCQVVFYVFFMSSLVPRIEKLALNILLPISANKRHENCIILPSCCSLLKTSSCFLVLKVSILNMQISNQSHLQL